MRDNIKENKGLYIGIAVIAAIVIILLIFSPFKSDKTQKDNLTDENRSSNISNIQRENLNSENDIEKKKQEPIAEPKNSEIVYSESGLCEDYVMAQGQTIKVDKHSVTLVKIGKGSVRIKVDGKDAILSGSTEEKIEGLNIVLNEKLFLYFAEDDPDNSVQFRIGCKGEELSEEKHILQNLIQRGSSICEALIKTCQDEFGTK